MIPHLFEIRLIESEDVVPWDEVALATIVEVAMGRSRHDEQSLVVGIFPVRDLLIGLLTKIAAMCLLSVHDEYWCTDLVGCNPKILIQAHEGSRDVPSHVRIERAGVVATFLRLVIIHILLEIVGGVIRGCSG